jgi:hypothetical protein
MMALTYLTSQNSANLFQCRDFATYNIPDDELRRHLLSLTNPKMKILNKSTNVRPSRL